MSSMSGTGRSSGLTGTGYKQVTTPTQGPEGMDIYRRLYEGSKGGVNSALEGLSGLAGGGEEQFRQLEAPALRQFGELQGQLASRFSGMGSGGRKSSGFQNASSGAATDLAERLQGQRLGLQQNAWQQLLGMQHQLLGTQTQETSLIPKKKSFLQELLLSLGSGAGSGFGTLGGYGAGKKIFG